MQKLMLIFVFVPCLLFGFHDSDVTERFIITGLTYEPIDRMYYVTIQDIQQDVEYFYHCSDREYDGYSIENDIFTMMIWEKPFCVLWGGNNLDETKHGL